jgi:cytochrome c
LKRGSLKTLIAFALVAFALVVFVLVNAAPAQNPAPGDGENLINGSDCLSCHALDSQVAGPSWRAIAKRYASRSGSVPALATKVRKGGGGTWGDVAMTPHPDLTDMQAMQMVEWILSLKEAPFPSKASKPQAQSKLYSYTPKSGPPVRLDFPLFVPGKPGQVTKDVFRGYELFNSYCYRCHGTDATGSQLGPDLRHSLASGMTQQQFLAIAMAGRKEKGMPAWAGFLSREEVIQTYQYTKGRSLDLVPAGRPPSGTQ